MFDHSDTAIIHAYIRLGIPADRIAAFLPKRNEFLQLLHDEVVARASDDELIWRLLQLRKSSKLPSLKIGGR